MFRSKDARFEAMVRACTPHLYRFAYALCRDRTTAEDLVQETFRRAWEYWPTLRDEKAAKAWLLTTLRRERARLFERRRPETVAATAAELAAIAIDAAPGRLEMREALARLPIEYREPLVLQVMFGFSGAEIGRLMSLSEGAVTTRLSRARQALRRLVDPAAADARAKAAS